MLQRHHRRNGDRKKTSGASATNSAAYRRKRSLSPAPHRVSIVTLRPSVQPNCCRPCTNAVIRRCDCGSSAASEFSTPMRRICSGCCARAASDHATGEPATALMKSRRRIAFYAD
jgi:hypothetical protein